jgi:hypothetical protein
MTPQQSGQQQQLMMVDTTCGSLLRELQVCFLVCSSNICRCCVLACCFQKDWVLSHTRRDVPKSRRQKEQKRCTQEFQERFGQLKANVCVFVLGLLGNAAYMGRGGRERFR